MKEKAASRGEPIPSDKSILKQFRNCSVFLILYIFFVNLLNTSSRRPFIPEFVLCMNSNFEEAFLDLHYYKFLILIPFTFIICINIHFDMEDNPIFTTPRLSAINTNQSSDPILDELPLKTSFVSGLFIVLMMFWTMFLNCFDGGFRFVSIMLMVIFLIKGPLIANWTSHRLQHKSLKKNQQKTEEVEPSLSAQPEHSQLENDVLNDIQNMNVL